MRTRVQKWGNSLALRIPKPFAEESKLAAESEVELTIVEGALSIRPVGDASWRLSDLLSRVSKRNLHGEQPVGPAVGREVW